MGHKIRRGSLWIRIPGIRSQQHRQQINDGILNPTTNTGNIMSPAGNGTSSSSLKMAGTNKTNNNIKSKSTRRSVSNHRNRKYSTSRELSEEEERLQHEKLEAQMDAFLRGEEEEEYQQSEAFGKMWFEFLPNFFIFVVYDHNNRY
jgi:hypothetical protein